MLLKFLLLKDYLLLLVLVTIVASCGTRGELEVEEGQFTDINEEFSQVVIVGDEILEEEATKGEPAQETARGDAQLKPESRDPKKIPPKAQIKPYDRRPKKPEAEVKMKREPEIEDAEGFVGRRPKVDPFRVGERVVLSVNYFNVSAGDIILEARPRRVVNGRSVYHFAATARSNRVFSMFYSVRNNAETFVDYETLLPLTLTYDANESSRVKEIRSFFDSEKNIARVWEKEVRRGEDERKKELEWEIEPFAQNVLSAIFYIRNFTLTPGKTFEFRIADNEKNYTFTGEVLRREVLSTPVGDLPTVVVKPTFQAEGSFSPSGDNLLWFTDDHRKLLVRIEAKVRIGTLVGRLKELKR